MIIGGLQKFSVLDYPEHLSAIIFTKGCNFRCHFCYNPMLVRPDTSAEGGGQKDYPVILEDNLFDFLKSRVGKLDGIVITGGEPTFHKDLDEFIQRIKNLGFHIKLDTNGTNPEAIKKLLNKKSIDYIAMDIKASPEKYDIVTGVQPEIEKIRESIKLIMKSGLPYEFRTTILPDFHKTKDIEEMAKMIKGARTWYLQEFKSDIPLLNEDFEGTESYKKEDFEKMKKIAEKYVKNCDIR